MYKKIDANQKELVKIAREMGASVQSLASVGHGCPDLVIGYKGVNLLVEVKDGSKSPSHRALTIDEKTWHLNWRGNVKVISSNDEMIQLLQSVG